MTDKVKEVNENNIEYIKDQSYTNNIILKNKNKVNSEYYNLQINDKSEISAPAFLVIFSVGIVCAIFLYIMSEKSNFIQNTNYEINNTYKLYKKLEAIKVHNKNETSYKEITILNKNNKNIWGGKIESNIDKSGNIKIIYENVQSNYCEPFINRQKVLDWTSISISDNKDKSNIVNYKDKVELLKACSASNGPVYITFKGK
jgi:hypothetical protein